MEIATAKLQVLLDTCHKQHITVSTLNQVQAFYEKTQTKKRSFWKRSLKLALLFALLFYALHFYLHKLQSKRCLLEMPTTVRYGFRPPENCNFCENVHKIEYRHDLSSEEFAAKYAYTGRPLIVEDATRNWTALTVSKHSHIYYELDSICVWDLTQKFNYWYFRDVYNRAKRKQKVLSCQFFPYKTGFRNIYEALSMPSERVDLQNGTQPWYFGWSNCQSELAEEFRKHYGRPYFLPKTSENNAVDWFFIGSAGLGAHMHVDNVRLPSWQAQLAGSKRWVLMPPPECYFKCRRLDVVVRTGDMIILDTNKWYHQTFVQPGTVSLTVGAEYD